MNIQVQQRSQYQIVGWWRWSVWLEGPQEDLDQIEYVEYTLHPTFPKPVRRITNRRTNFCLSASGWSEFTIYIDIKLKNEEILKREHRLILEDASAKGKQTSAEVGKSPALFLSSGMADLPLAYKLSEALREKKVEVLMPDDIKPGLPWEVSLSLLLDRANMAAVIVSDKPSPWVMREIEALKRRNIPLVPVLVGRQEELPDPLRNLPTITVKSVTDIRSIGAAAKDIDSKLRTTYVGEKEG